MTPHRTTLASLARRRCSSSSPRVSCATQPRSAPDAVAADRTRRQRRIHGLGHGPRRRFLHRRAAVHEDLGRRGVGTAVRAADRRLRRAQPRRAPAPRRRGDRADRVPRAEGTADPADVRANDRIFQHIAIVVRDHARGVRASAASTASSTRPPDRSGCPTGTPMPAASARSTSAIPDRHFLELICVSAGKGRRALAAAVAARCSSASITRRSSSTTPSARCALYRDALGLQVAGGSENYDVEQEHLNNVFGARLRITALRRRERTRHRAARVPRAARWPAGAAGSARQRHRALADHARRRAARLAAAACADHALALVSPGPVDVRRDARFPCGRADARPRRPRPPDRRR